MTERKLLSGRGRGRVPYSKHRAERHASLSAAVQELRGHTRDFAQGNAAIAGSYAVRCTTTKFAVGSNGIIRATNMGIISESQWRDFFNAALA